LEIEIFEKPGPVPGLTWAGSRLSENPGRSKNAWARTLGTGKP